MKIKNIFLIIFFTIVSSNLFGEEIKNKSEIESNSLFKKYFEPHLCYELFKYATETDLKLGIAFNDNYKMSNENAYLLTPIVMQKDKKHPTKGIWFNRFDLIRNGKIRTYNVRFEARPNGPPEVFPMIMGKTKTTYEIAKKILPAVKNAAKSKIKNINIDEYNKTFIVADTILLDPGYKKLHPNEPDYLQKEKWIIRACGQEASLTIVLMFDELGYSGFGVFQ